MRISDWSSDVCSSDQGDSAQSARARHCFGQRPLRCGDSRPASGARCDFPVCAARGKCADRAGAADGHGLLFDRGLPGDARSEEHTSELQSLMRISYAVFCLKKKNKKYTKLNNNDV